MNKPFAVLFAALLALPAAAMDFTSYDGCAKLAQQHPKKALEQASDWEIEGGGAAAGHCQALALAALKRYDKAAAKLTEVAKSDGVGDFRRRADLFDQAGNAWLLAGKPRLAQSAFSAALRLVAGNAEIWADRARARVRMQDWFGADADLSAALKIDSQRADLLSLRAQVRRRLGLKTAAATDILRALTLYPDYPAALVERGAMKFDVGDIAGARKDWQKAAGGRGASAVSAKRLLEKLGPAPKKMKIE